MNSIRERIGGFLSRCLTVLSKPFASPVAEQRRRFEEIKARWDAREQEEKEAHHKKGKRAHSKNELVLSDEAEETLRQHLAFAELSANVEVPPEEWQKRLGRFTWKFVYHFPVPEAYIDEGVREHKLNASSSRIMYTGKLGGIARAAAELVFQGLDVHTLPRGKYLEDNAKHPEDTARLADALASLFAAGTGGKLIGTLAHFFTRQGAVPPSVAEHALFVDALLTLTQRLEETLWHALPVDETDIALTHALWRLADVFTLTGDEAAQPYDAHPQTAHNDLPGQNERLATGYAVAALVLATLLEREGELTPARLFSPQVIETLEVLGAAFQTPYLTYGKEGEENDIPAATALGLLRAHATPLQFSEAELGALEHFAAHTPAALRQQLGENWRAAKAAAEERYHRLRDGEAKETETGEDIMLRRNKTTGRGV